MRVFITGGTGLIGRVLSRRLVERGDAPVILTRQAEKARLDPGLKGFEFVQGDPTSRGPWMEAVEGCEAVVNLVGHGVFSKRWDPGTKQAIRDSRIDGTSNVVDAIASAKVMPKVLVQASAIGYYGPHGDEELTEASPPGADFMAKVCLDWEKASVPVDEEGVRRAILRVGVVLAPGGGALDVMTPFFKLGPGVPIGSGGGLLRPALGMQWLSWIHIDDIVGLFLMALDDPNARGPINGTAPQPVRNADFAKALSKVLWKWYAPWRIFLPLGPPDLLLRIVLGEVAEVVTKGQKVLPAKALSLGYPYRFPELAGALRDVLGEDERAVS
ncbi:TIGR01777 family oxidoreductase [Singulisphaera rosea]